MTPPGSGGRRGSRSHLTLVSGGDPSTAPETTSATESSAPSDPITTPPPESGPGTRASLPSLPPRSADLLGLRNLVEGHATTTTHHQQLLAFLGELANPASTNGYDVSFENRSTRYRIFQEMPGAPIELTVTQQRPAAPGQTPAQVELIRMTYLPNGQISSNLHGTPHATLERGPERSYHEILRGVLNERAQRMVRGSDLFTRICDSLRALRGNYTPETQSVWYDNFAVLNGKVYSFRRRNLLGLGEMSDNPQLNQISIYEETGTERVKVATISANGEVDFNTERLMASGSTAREPISHAQLTLLESLASPLEGAKANPEAYRQRLRSALQALPNFENLNPAIERSVDIPRVFSAGSGPYGNMMEIRTGRDLLRNIFAGHRWENPEQPGEVRYLRPPWRLSRSMTRELVRWVTRTSIYFLYQNIRDPKPMNDTLRLQLFPEGGGQLNVYRNQSLHDIIIAGPKGPLWRADQEIRQLQRGGATFPNRMAALDAAVARRSQNPALPIALRVQEAPHFDLSRFHFDMGGSPQPVRSAQEAWRFLQQQIPAGIEPRVQYRVDSDSLVSLLSPTAEPNRIVVDFRESQPALHLDINQQMIEVGGTKVPRVQILMKRGEDTHARVFENGVPRPDLARDVHQASLRQAQQGAVERGLFTRGGQGLLRGISHIRTSGLTYGASYFLSLPFILGYEHLVFNSTERRLIGTPGLEANLSWTYFKDHVMKPFGVMAVSSGAGTLLVDGAFNSLPSLVRAAGIARTTEASFSQALRLHRPSFYNPSPIVRPLAPPMALFRGFLQRAVPLFMGLTAMDYYQHGRVFSPAFLRNARDVALVSAGSSLLLQGVYASSSLSSAGVRMGMLEEVGTAGATRFGLRIWGGIAVATLEMVALGMINAHERRALIEETGNALRTQLGQAIDRRNELLTRLENGEEVAPRYLASADAELQGTQAAYRRFLELTERRSGSGAYAPIASSNDFEAEQHRYERERILADTTHNPLNLAQAEAAHEERLRNLRGRYQRMEQELDTLYGNYGVNRQTSEGGTETLRDFLHRQATRLEADPTLGDSNPVSSAPGQPAAVAATPVTVNSPEGQAIVEQMRWKAAQDPSFLLWSRERRAGYILQQFRGYRVTDADGTSRPWNQGEALAFLGSVDQANTQRINNLETPITMPQPQEGFDTNRLDTLLRSEREIRERENQTHRHAGEHASILANNIEDFDRQMETYIHGTNERTAIALTRIMGEAEVAMVDPLPGSATVQ